MSRDAALRSAISLVSVPSQVRATRLAPLPDGTTLLLGVAAGDPDALAEAMALTGRTQEVLTSAAAFFIEQILLVPDADSYRALGCVPGASAGELRTNMALLMRWLHPDVSTAAQKEVYVSLVTKAWEDVKTPDRRQAYDAARANAPVVVKRTSKTRRTTKAGRLRIQKPSLFERAISRLFRRDRPFN
jgi:hypothetical protein